MSVAWAQAWVPGKNQGSVSLSYLQKKSTKLTNADGSSVPFGKVIVRSLYLTLDYGLSDRWAISAGLPFGSNRYTGNDPHDPSTFPFPNDQRFLDDGHFHGGWTDWSVALRYQWRSEPFLITPFIAYSRPSHDYTFFAHSALGTHQWALQTGVHIGKWFPAPWQNAYWQMGYAYTFEQPVDHRRVNHGALSLELGYHLTPRLSGHVLIEHSNSYGNGINALQDFGNPNGSPNFDNIFYHDQLLLARYTKASLGLDYQLNDRYQVSILYGRTLSAANAHFWDYEAAFGISRSF